MKVEELFSVKGLACVVTGAASGIGLAMAEAMADNGARVTLMDVDAENLERAVQRLKQRGGDVRGQVMDVTKRDQVYSAFDEVAEVYGRLDVCFANAGITSGPGFTKPTGEPNEAGFIENYPEERWDRIVATNLTGVFTTIRAAAKHMKKNAEGGSIVVTTSVAALRDELFVGYPYTAAKAGAAHLARNAALELARYKIRVNAIAPGPFDTNLSGTRLSADPSRIDSFAKMVPLRRVADTEEMQGTALYLASPASSFVTGAQMVVDGGITLGRD